MPKHFISFNNGYYYEAWYEPGPSGKRKLCKKPIKDQSGKTVKDRTAAILLLHARKENGIENISKTTIEAFIPKFEDYLRSKGKKETSIKIYLHDVRKSISNLPLYIQDVKREHIENYINSIQLSPATKGKYAKSISRFFKVAKRLGYIRDFPMEGYEFPKYQQTIAPYTEKEVLKLIETAKELEKELKEPYYAFMVLALQTGLRLDEYVNLRWKYLNVRDRTYTICVDDIWRPKHDRKRIITIPKTSAKLLAKLPRDSEYIFHKSNSKKHDHFTRDFVNAVFKAAEISGNLHQIRKTYASYRLAIEGNQYKLKEHLGHNSLKEIEAYVGMVNASKKMRKIFGEY